MIDAARIRRVAFLPAVALLGLVAGSWMAPRVGRSEKMCPDMQCNAVDGRCYDTGNRSFCDEVHYPPGCVTRPCNP